MEDGGADPPRFATRSKNLTSFILDAFVGNNVLLCVMKHAERKNPNYLAVAGWKNVISSRGRLAVKSLPPPPHANPNTGMYSEAEFIVPDWGDKVNSGIGLYRPARLHRLAGRYKKPYTL